MEELIYLTTDQGNRFAINISQIVYIFEKKLPTDSNAIIYTTRDEHICVKECIEEIIEYINQSRRKFV